MKRTLESLKKPGLMSGFFVPAFPDVVSAIGILHFIESSCGTHRFSHLKPMRPADDFLLISDTIAETHSLTLCVSASAFHSLQLPNAGHVGWYFRRVLLPKRKSKKKLVGEENEKQKLGLELILNRSHIANNFIFIIIVSRLGPLPSRYSP